MMFALERWRESVRPTETALRAILVNEGLSPSRWSNGPGDTYAAHSHDYHKVLFCLSGSIVFSVQDETVELRPGDRLEIEPETLHSAVVGPEGAVCLEAARRVSGPPQSGK